MTHNPQVLQLREYESAAIGSTWDAAQKVVPAQVVAEIERIQSEQRLEYLAVSRRRITAQNFVGVIGIGERAIEILPKTDSGSDATRRRLIGMLSVAGLLPHLRTGIADLAPSVPCLLDAFMQAYIRELTLEWRRGRISSYHRTDGNRTSLKGRLLFQEQIRQNRLRPERFFTRADEFTVDVLPSRLLRAGLDICRRHGVADATRREARTLLAEFDDVTDCSFTEAELNAIQPDRRLTRFQPLLSLARQLVRGQVPDHPGRAATYSLLFDMNVVFEQYVGNLLRRVCRPPYQIQLQVSGRSLVRRNGIAKFRLRPDVGVRHGQQFAALIDTKWKLLDPARTHEGVRQADMYQAYAYAREYGCPHVILLYPRNGSLDRLVATYRLEPSGEQSPRIEVATVDVAADVGQVREELAGILQSCTGELAAQ